MGFGMQWHQQDHMQTICRQITTPTPHHSIFYSPDALPDTQPTVSKHWRRIECSIIDDILNVCVRVGVCWGVWVNGMVWVMIQCFVCHRVVFCSSFQSLLVALLVPTRSLALSFSLSVTLCCQWLVVGNFHRCCSCDRAANNRSVCHCSLRVSRNPTQGVYNSRNLKFLLEISRNFVFDATGKFIISSVIFARQPIFTTLYVGKSSGVLFIN